MHQYRIKNKWSSESSLIFVWPGSFHIRFASDPPYHKDNFSQNLWIMICVMVSGNKSKEMLQIFELSHLQMANSFNSAHNSLLFFSFEEQCKSGGLAMSLLRKGCSSVPTPAHRPVSEATGCESHETKIFHGAKSKHHVFVPKSWHIDLINGQLPELVTMLWGK